MLNVWDREPVMILQAAVVLITVVLVVLAELTSSELAMILAALQLLVGVAARSEVTPVAKLGEGD